MDSDSLNGKLYLSLAFKPVALVCGVSVIMSEL